MVAAMVPQVNGFQPHSVWLRQQQNSSSKIFCIDIACYFAAATATATQYEHFGPIVAKTDIKNSCRCIKD